VKRVEALLNREIGLCARSIGSRAIEGSTRERMLACGTTSVDDYVLLLARDPAERRALVEQIVVSETWFFRDDDVFRTLTEYVGNTWRKAHPESVLRVLSIPCATGEEAYSTSITLLEAGLPATKYAIHAVDVSDRVVEFAKRGTYGKNSFRGVASPQRQAYFRAAGEGQAVAADARRSVMFQRGNVLDPSLAKAASFSVIFCRNLLIYLDRAARTRALDNIYNWLLPDGILFAGHAEGLDTMDHRFQRGAGCGSFGFVKRETLRVVVEPVRKDPSCTATPRKPKPVPLVPRRVNASQPQPLATSLAPAPASLSVAQQLADQGNLSLAAATCERLIHESGPSAEAYCLMGIVRTALGEAERALECFNKAVYLEPKHYTALANLALAHERRGENSAAQNFRRRAQDALGKGPTP
jgi:chemotaxis protein methyltransferase WspC